MDYRLLLLLLSFIGIQRVRGQGCAAVQCGQPVVQPAAHRVVGGQEALRGSWPWTVALAEEDFVMCGGAIISDRVILTAAHCFDHPDSLNVSRWTVRAGKHQLTKSERGEMAFTVEKIIMHEHYAHSTVDNDIALMIVRESIPFTPLIRPICIPGGAEDTAPLSPGTACLLAGWGDTKNTGPQGVLMEVMVPLVSDAVCSLPGWYYTHFIPNKTFCAGYQGGGKDACVGDSGAPLISQFEDGRWYVTGISSWGYGCAEPRWPGVYTNVTYYLPWIHQTRLTNGLPGACQVDIVG